MTNDLTLVDENINPVFEQIKKLVNTSGNKVYSTVNTDDNLEKMRKFYNMFSNSETLARKFKLVSLFGNEYDK